MRRITRGLALALMLGASGGAAGAPAPASPEGVPSQPASAPAVETIVDPDDPGGWAPAPGPARPAPDPRTVLRARLLLRLALDTWHASAPVAGGAAGSEDVMDLLWQASASVDHRAREWLRLRVGGRLYHRVTAQREPGTDTYLLFNGELHRSDLEAELLDSFAQLTWRRLDVSAGLVTRVWGASALVTPNDVLTVRELRGGPAEDPWTGRLPVPLVVVEADLGPLSAEAVWLPTAARHRVDLFGSDWALLGPLAPAGLSAVGRLAAAVAPDSVEGELQPAVLQTGRPRPVTDSSGAVQLRGRVGGWDLSAQYAYLYDRLPVLAIHRDLALLLAPVLAGGAAADPDLVARLGDRLAAEPFPLRSTYRRCHQAGLGVSGGLGPIGLTLDVAYRSREAVAVGGAVPLVALGSTPWLSTAVDSQVLAHTVGLTYTRGERLQVTAEWWHRAQLDLLDEAARPPLHLGGPQLGGVALFARYRLPWLDLSAQILVVSDLLNRSVVVTPQLGYRLGDHLLLRAGATLLEGAEHSLGGQLDQNDQVFLGAEAYL